MPEHVPLTDAELDEIDAFANHSDSLLAPRAKRLTVDLREARRLLRAVEDWCGWIAAPCTQCGHVECEVQRYLAACAGKDANDV